MEPINLFALLNLDSWIKWALVILGGIYAFYAFLVVRQVSLMKRVLENAENPLITLLAYAHFLAALGLTALAFISS